MDWNRVQGSWSQYSGQAKAMFTKLTDDDLMQAAGSREKLEGIIEKRYGFDSTKAKAEVDKWVSTLH